MKPYLSAAVYAGLAVASAALGQYYRSTDGGDHWEALPRRLGETRALIWVPV